MPSSSCPCPPAPSPHSRTEAWTPSPGSAGQTCTVTHDSPPWSTHACERVCDSPPAHGGTPAAAGAGRASTGWAPPASCTPTGRWPSPSPARRRRRSARFLSRRTESCQEHMWPGIINTITARTLHVFKKITQPTGVHFKA